jgi:glycerol uptake facilitator-like aquaporin
MSQHASTRSAPALAGLDPRVLAAELLGTFTLVFVGAAAVVGASRVGSSVHVVAAFGFGLALLAGLYAFGEVSGGHFNPAVSLAMFLDKRLIGSELVGGEWTGFWVYVLGPLLGGALAWLVHEFVVRPRAAGPPPAPVAEALEASPAAGPGPSA